MVLNNISYHLRSNIYIYKISNINSKFSSLFIINIIRNSKSCKNKFQNLDNNKGKKKEKKGTIKLYFVTHLLSQEP